MRKILVLVSDILSTILAGIAFGLGGLSAINLVQPGFKPVGHGNYYQIVWREINGNMNVANIVIFILFCVATFVTLVTLFNFKGRKWVMLINALLLVGLGISMFFLPEIYFNGYKDLAVIEPLGLEHLKITGGMIAMAILVISSGVLSLTGSVVDVLLAKKEN